MRAYHRFGRYPPFPATPAFASTGYRERPQPRAGEVEGLLQQQNVL